MINISSLCLPAEAEETAVNTHFSYASSFPHGQILVAEWRVKCGGRVFRGERVWLWTEPTWSPTGDPSSLPLQSQGSDAGGLSGGCLLRLLSQGIAAHRPPRLNMLNTEALEQPAPPICVSVLLLHLFHYSLMRGVPAADRIPHHPNIPSITYLIAPFSSLRYTQ